MASGKCPDVSTQRKIGIPLQLVALPSEANFDNHLGFAEFRCKRSLDPTFQAGLISAIPSTI